MKRLLSLLFLSLVSFAAPVFTISPNIVTTAPGGIADPFCLSPSLQCALFSGTIDPDISNDYFLTSVGVVFNPVPTPTGLSHDPNFFTINVPGLLLATDSPYAGPIFEIDVDPFTALGIYTGTVTFFGGLNPGELNVLGSQAFTLVVAPEPATASMVLLGCAGIALARFRKR